jgi:hypothetical protein
MIRTYADQKARQFGITRAQWVVLVRLDRFEGLKQSEHNAMPDTILKLVPSVERRRTRATRLMGFLRRRKRILLMLVVSLVAAVAGGLFYMSGGRYVSIDDDYVHAAKLMVSTDVSGIVDSVNVREGQSVKTGDVLFRLDPRPFQIALATLRAGA